MKIPKIPPVVWIIGAVAVGAVVITKLFGSGDDPLSKLLDSFGLGGLKSPKCGPGLYASWSDAGYWSISNGEARFEVLRVAARNASNVTLQMSGSTLIEYTITGQGPRLLPTGGVPPITIYP